MRSRTIHRLGAAGIVASVLAAGAPTLAADATTYSWGYYLTVYASGQKQAVGKGGVHGINASQKAYMSAYVRDPKPGGRGAFGQLVTWWEASNGVTLSHNRYNTAKTYSSNYRLYRVSRNIFPSAAKVKTNPAICEERPVWPPCDEGGQRTQSLP